MALLQTCLLRVMPLGGCKTKARLAYPSGVKQRNKIRAALLPELDSKAIQVSWSKSSRLAVAGVIASGLLWLSPLSAEADVQTVSPQLVTQMARPLPKQTVDKGKIWTVFIGGAVLLFGATVFLENNENLFPSISRANKAFRMAAQQFDEMEERKKAEDELLRLRQAQYDEEQRQLALVKEGMREARAKVLKPNAAVESVVMPASTAPQPEARSQIVAQTSTSAATDTKPYVVVEDAVPDLGAVAWSPSSATSAAAGPSEASTSAHSEEAPRQAAVAASGVAAGLSAAESAAATSAEDSESMARVGRLQEFVSGTMAGSKSAMEAFKAQRQ